MAKEYVPKCLACEGPIKAEEERVAVVTGRGRTSFLYRHASDADCARYLRNYASRIGHQSYGPVIDDPDYTENGYANMNLTDRPVRKGAR
jgi:hypothetical protein